MAISKSSQLEYGKIEIRLVQGILMIAIANKGHAKSAPATAQMSPTLKVNNDKTHAAAKRAVPTIARLTNHKPRVTGPAPYRLSKYTTNAKAEAK